MSHLMLDLETMGNASDAAVTAIGAAFFDIKTGRVDATFHLQLCLQNEIDAGASVSAGTIQFWLSQPQGVAEKAMFSLPVNARAALDDFARWVTANVGPETDNVKLWGNGATFDNVIIENAFRRHGIKSPFKFWNHRDVRTVLDLSREMGYDARADTPFKGTPHVAIDDVKHQVAYLSAAYRHITGKENVPGSAPAENWIEWDGTGVQPSGVVRVKFRNGNENEERGRPADQYYWRHSTQLDAYDIVAYRHITRKENVPDSAPAENWIRWSGTGDIPEGRVQVKLRSGEVSERLSGHYRWGHLCTAQDIVAYRKIKDS